MLYLIAVFFILAYVNRESSLSHLLLLSLMVFPALFYIVGLTGVKIPYSRYGDTFAMLLFAVFLVYKFREPAHRIMKKDTEFIFSLFIGILAFFGFAFLYRDSIILPRFDATIIPSLAKIIYKNGHIPTNLLPLTSDVYIYPPGFSVLLSVFYSFEDPFLVLFVFKYLNLIVVSLTPFVWAVYFNKIYQFKNVKWPYILLAFYGGFFLFDRTILLGLVFAGKNAILYCVFLMPAFLYTFLKESRTAAEKIIVVFCGLGMILNHYSFLFIFSTLVFFHILVNFSSCKKDILKFLSLFVSSCLLFLPFYLTNIKSGKVPSLEVSNPSLRTVYDFFKEVLIGHEFNLFWLFGHLNKPWKFKRILILAIFAIPAVTYLFQRFRNRASENTAFSTEKALWTAFLSIFGTMVFVSFLTIKPVIHVDYVRWYIYNYVALLSSIFFIFAFTFLNRLHFRFHHVVIPVIILGLFLSVQLLILKDFQSVRWMVNLQKVTRSELEQVRDVLAGISDESCMCNIIANGHVASGVGWMHTLQEYRPLGYAYVLSNCRMINGSFFTRPLKESRYIMGLPSADFYTSFKDGDIHYIGKKNILENYLSETKGISVEMTDFKLGDNVVCKIYSRKENEKVK